MFVSTNAGAKNIFLLYFSCVILSLAPLVVGPPERNFTQGQPELQQAMDNMIGEKAFMKRTVRLPSTEENELTEKTNLLLEEAEQLLTALKNAKEKEWMAGFVHKLHMLASVLEQSVTNQSSETKSFFEPQSLNSFQQNSSDLKSRAVPESTPRPKLSDETTSTFLLTLPKANQEKPVTDPTAEQLVLTTPGLAPVKEIEKEDELVRELQSLRKNEPSQQSIEAPETSSIYVVIESTIEPNINITFEKEKIKERMAKEVVELKKLGETEEGIIKALHIDGSKLVEAVKFKSDNGKEFSKVKETNKSPDGHESVKRVLNEENGKNLNQNYLNQPAFNAAEPPRQIYMNNTFLGMHINLSPMTPRLLRRPFHYGLQGNPMIRNYPFYRVGLRDTIQRAHAQNAQNYMMGNHMFGVANGIQQGRSVEVNPYVISQSDGQYPPDNSNLNQHPKFDVKSVYMPYPFNQNSENPNDTQTKITQSPPTEFTDEMKRQLRDGKVILLSDSVVRSNFSLEAEAKGKPAK